MNKIKCPVCKIEILKQNLQRHIKSKTHLEKAMKKLKGGIGEEEREGDRQPTQRRKKITREDIIMEVENQKQHLTSSQKKYFNENIIDYDMAHSNALQALQEEDRDEFINSIEMMKTYADKIIKVIPSFADKFAIDKHDITKFKSKEDYEKDLRKGRKRAEEERRHQILETFQRGMQKEADQQAQELQKQMQQYTTNRNNSSIFANQPPLQIMLKDRSLNFNNSHTLPPQEQSRNDYLESLISKLERSEHQQQNKNASGKRSSYKKN